MDETSPAGNGDRLRTVLHVGAIVVVVVGATVIALAYLCTFAPAERWLLDGLWDDGRVFYTIAREGYSADAPGNFRELGLYPLVLRLFLPVAGVWSLLIVSVAAAVACSLQVYVIGRRWYLPVTGALIFALVFSLARLPTFFMPFLTAQFPPMTVLTSIQGSEPLFLALCLGSFIAWKRERLWLTFLLVGLAAVTRITGLIVAAGYCAALLERRQWRAVLWGVLPGGLLTLHFLYYLCVSGDFLAFLGGHGEFYAGGVLSPPFADLLRAFVDAEPRLLWETRWGWLVNYTWCIVAIVYLWRRERILFWLTAPSFLLFVSLNGWALHSRYYVTLWAVPFAYALWLGGRCRRDAGEPMRSNHETDV